MGFFIGKCNEALRFMGPSLQIRQCRLDGLNDFHLQKNQQLGVGAGVGGRGTSRPTLGFQHTVKHLFRMGDFKPSNKSLMGS